MKRGRDDEVEYDEVESLLDRLLQCAAHEGPETKLRALSSLVAAIDPADASYEVQRRTHAGGGLDVVADLLVGDPSPAVAAAAAAALAALVDHAGSVRDRIESGHFAATPATSPLNPIQSAAGELPGVFAALLDLKLGLAHGGGGGGDDDDGGGGVDEAAAAASDALAALTSLNRGNTAALMHELVARLAGGGGGGGGAGQLLAALDDLAAGAALRDELAVVADQALGPALRWLRHGAAGARERAPAARLLATLVEARGRGAAAFLAAEGALADALRLLAEGDLEERDAAAALAWLLVSGDKRLLDPRRSAGGGGGGPTDPGSSVCGVDARAVVRPLLELVELAEAGERRRDGDDGDGGDGGGEGGSGGGAPTLDVGPAGCVAVDNGDAAASLLRALAAANPDIAALLPPDGDGKGEGVDGSSSPAAAARATSCVMM